MYGLRCPLPIAAALLLAGCQSMSLPAGSSALFGLKADTPETSAEVVSSAANRPRALFGSSRQPTGTQTPQPRESRTASLSGPLSEDKVDGTGGSLTQPSATQIILTEAADIHHESASVRPRTTSPSMIDWRSLRGGTIADSHPLMAFDSELSAPLPASGSPTGDTDADPSSTPVGDRDIVAPVVDAFGIGGEREAARAEADGASAIQPAGHSTADDGSTPDAGPGAVDLKTTKSLQSVYWQEDLDKLIALLEAQAAQQSPGESHATRELYVRQHVALRMLYLIASRRPEALQAIPEIPHDDQEFWTQMFWALSSTFDDEAIPNRSLRAAETVARLQEAVRQIESRAALQLSRTLFCQRIDGFGDYVPFDEETFTPGQPVLLYTEVRNFQSQSTPEGDFRTVLRSSLTIREGGLNGRTVFDNDLPETEDRCRSQRRDYFHSYRVQLPTTLQPGPHVMILEVTDTLTGKTGTTTLNFVVK